MQLFSQGPIAQLDRASDFESEGWAFESLWDRQIFLLRKITKKLIHMMIAWEDISSWETILKIVIP